VIACSNVLLLLSLLIIIAVAFEQGVKWVAEPPGDLERVKAGGLDPIGKRVRNRNFDPSG
jgi:hypothetical protein